MGIGLAARVVLLAPSLLLAPPGAPTFSEAWYLEVVLGEVTAAGDLYRRVYEDMGAPPRAPTPMPIRLKAALRGGGCFERTGDTARAKEAYSWLLRSGPPDDPAVRSARIRLASLPAPVPISTGTPAPTATPASSPGPSAGPSPAQAEDPLLRLAARLDRRDAAIEGLRTETRRLSERDGEEARLLRRLQGIGIEVTFEDGKEGIIRAAFDDVFKPLDPEDRAALRKRLADRFYLRALRALAARDPARAADELRKCLRFASEARPDGRPDHRDASDLLRTVEGFLRPLDGAAKLAAARLRALREAEEDDLLHGMRSALAKAGRASKKANSLSRSEAERVLIEEEWAPEGFERNLDARSAVREALDRLVLDPSGAPTVAAGGGRTPRPEEVRLRARRSALDLLSAAEETVDLAWSSSEGRRATVGDPARPVSAEEMRDLIRRVSEEMESILARGEEKNRLKTQDAGIDNWKREFLSLQILSAWFPEADADQRYSRLAQEYLGR
jgi:hypothetical protein